MPRRMVSVSVVCVESDIDALSTPSPASIHSAPSPTRGGARKAKRAALWPPPCSTCEERLLHAEPAAAGAPDIDADEQEQPHHVDEMPVPGGELEAEVLLGREMPGVGTAEAHGQEYGSDNDMEAVEAGRHE